MLFNSFEFAVFLPLVFILYWFVFNKNLKIQNAFLLGVSYVFYGWWDWRFLSLIFISSLVDFQIGKCFSHIQKPGHRKILLGISILVNLGILGFFKYFNFFAESFVSAFSLFGKSFEISRLELLLPVGISFYTFQTMSYTIDVYFKKMKGTHDFIQFFAYVSFFPQLVAGPIERAVHLLPQFEIKRVFDIYKAKEGLRQILWGLIKKVVIADNCAEYANQIFSQYSQHNAATLALGALFFAFQIYGDFSGYSDIATGSAKLFGFRLMQNFSFPYFSRDISEFWRRWHISLSTWFRDYLYIPLGGSRCSKLKQIRNTFIIFIVSGFWHGANWTFLMWGAVHALYFIPLLLLGRNRKHLDIVASQKLLPDLKESVKIVFTFLLTCIAWIFFRAESLKDAFLYIGRLISFDIFSKPDMLSAKMLLILLFILIFMMIEWIGRHHDFALQNMKKISNRKLRWSMYYGMILALFIFSGNQQQFIYFQF
ncbi:MAG: MBOAT family protein [Candidatus Cloacimonetes bacterium]|nr:MBOAT family protein [Candidatus Cloacimonadota bacterium]